MHRTPQINMLRIFIITIFVGVLTSVDVLYFNAPFFGVFLVPIIFAFKLVTNTAEIYRGKLLVFIGLSMLSASVFFGWHRDKVILESMQKNLEIIKIHQTQKGGFPDNISDVYGIIGTNKKVNRFMILCKVIHYYHSKNPSNGKETAYLSYSTYGEQGKIIFDLRDYSIHFDMP